jgi:hypothetical protein
MEGRTSFGIAHRMGSAAAVGWRGRGKDRLNQAPLFIGEVHDF